VAIKLPHAFLFAEEKPWAAVALNTFVEVVLDALSVVLH
jgi:hypothetical protein